MRPRLYLSRWLPLTLAATIALWLAVTNTNTRTGPALAAEDLGTWSYALAKLPVPTGEVAVVELDGLIYAMGGVTANGRTTNVWRYDPANDAAGWVKRASFDPPGLDHTMAAAYGGKIYLFGGLTSWPFSSVDTVFEYDPAKDSWTRKAPMPTINGAVGLGSGGIAVLGDKIYIAGGANRSGRSAREALATLLAYSPATDSWDTSLPSMPTRRDHLVLLALNGKLHAIGGRDIDIDKVTNAHEIYDPATRNWKSSKRPADNIAPLPVARAGLGGGVLNGRIVVFGGEINGSSSPKWGVFPDTEEYNPQTNTWLRLNGMPRLPEQPGGAGGRHGTNGAVVENVLYVPAGSIKQGNAFTGVTAAFSRTLTLSPTATTTSSATTTASTTTTASATTTSPATTTASTTTTSPATTTTTETSTATPSETPQATGTTPTTTSTATGSPTAVPTTPTPGTAPGQAQAWIPLLIK